MQIAFLRHRLTFTAKKGGRLPGYLGSAWRGSFGNALRSIVCTTHLPNCASCPLYRECDYPQVFETPPDRAGHALLGRNEGLPNPYVLAPGWSGGGVVAPGDSLTLEVTLVGDAMSRQNIVFDALAKAAADGIGPHRVPLSLIGREPVSINLTQPMPQQLRLGFTTPLRLTVQGSLVTGPALRPRHILGAIARRVSLFMQYHNAGSIDIDFQDLKRRASIVEFSATNLVWRDWKRNSARQLATIQMGGLMGTAVLPMLDLEPFWPLLQLAPALHIGKGTVMGLGAVTLSDAG